VRWRGREQSSNIEDRRGTSIGRIGGIGGVGALVVALVAVFFGEDPSAVLQGLELAPSSQSQGPYQESPREGETREMISVVLKDTERTWHELLDSRGVQYQEPRLVLFNNAVQSACGSASSAVGPFYCPGDNRVYLDLSFFDELANRFGARGDFAQAYVVAHEIGHHVQNVLGIAERVHRSQQSDARQTNALSVRLELQADCFAGIWAHHADDSRSLIEPDDIQEALNAAAAIGDDRLQTQARGYVVPESFTHGTSAQRAQWFRRGFDSGRIDDCDTFGRD
jgi:uncharacterized protein